MPIKIQLPDNSPSGKRKLANAKGQLLDTKTSNNTNPYPGGERTTSTFNTVAQIGGGVGVIKTSQAQPAIAPPMFYSPLHTPQNWQTATKRKEVYSWARFYYDNEPKVAAGVDFYSQFGMSGFQLECKNPSVLNYFNQFVKDLKLEYWFRLISHEYYLIGDVFPFLEIQCKKCQSTGFLPNGDRCNHPDGKFSKITILNPDFVNVKDSMFLDQREYELIPDEEMKRMVQSKKPKNVYESIPEHVLHLIQAGNPIPLSKHSVSHIKHAEVPYGKYGTSMLRRLFTILAYKTKLMTANWIISERLILPVRLVKVGSAERPAGPEDIMDMLEHLRAVANDPNLTIVTHHAVDMDWIGSTGKIHNIDTMMEQIGKEILDGLMLNQALLNGEMQSYGSAAVGVETLIKRIQIWQNRLAEWAKEHIFLPMCQMQGFVDEEASKELGKTVYEEIEIKWNNLELRDKSNKLQMLMQLFDKNLISREKLLSEFDIDYDQEVVRMRAEQLEQNSTGAIMPNAGGAGAPMGGPGGAGGMDLSSLGGAGGPPPGGDLGAMGMPPAGAEVPPAGGMPDMSTGGPAAPSPSGTPPSTASSELKVYKKGKAPKNEKEDIDTPIDTPQVIKLTKIEQKIWKVLSGMQLPFKIYAQYKQPIKGKAQPYVLDFAIPQIGISIESDGAIWHDPIKDAERDKILASYGWTTLRFSEDAINSKLDAVQQVISDNIKEAADQKFRKKKAFSTENIKYGLEPRFTPQYNIVALDVGKVQIISGVLNESTESTTTDE
jgi:very-short-patch-repair endonuclease